jgi:hypothetical protein
MVDWDAAAGAWLEPAVKLVIRRVSYVPRPMEASEAVELATEPPAPSAEAAFASEVRRNLPRNYAAHLVHGLFGQTGFRLVTAPTFIPEYIHTLSGGSAVWVGVARSAQALGQCLSPLFSATVIEHRRKVLPVALRVGNLVRAQVLGMGLAGFFLGTRQNPWDTVQKKPGKELYSYFNVEDFVPDEWKNEYPVAAFSRMTERDGAWMARILARFTPDVVGELDRTPAERRHLVEEQDDRTLAVRVYVVPPAISREAGPNVAVTLGDVEIKLEHRGAGRLALTRFWQYRAVHDAA